MSETPTSSDGYEPVARRLPPRAEEAILAGTLLDWDWLGLRKKLGIPDLEGLKLVSISSGRHQAAEGLARHTAGEQLRLQVQCFHIDSFQASRTEGHLQLAEDNSPVPSPGNVEVLCDADLPDSRFHAGLLSLVTTGEGELSRDYIQQLFHHLVLGGVLFVSVDNPDDRWVLDQLKTFERSVKVRKHEQGTVYWIEKTAELKKRKDFACELAYRDCDELIKMVTRPGVFSHRHLDNGARQLLDAVDVYPESKLIDIGCGAGSVALGLAKRDPSARVHAVDANARAIDCVQRGIRLNGLTNLTTEVNWTGVYGEPGSYDMALANPPYFGDFHIAEKFLAAAHRSLRPGGRLVLVTKHPNWYEANLGRWFEEGELFPSRRYHIASGVKPKA
ncbi:Ribosomal RNA small subunit methyltransferase C [Pirellula sp. SH-Sr6A]|uniref:class I SAM-dependent methyltransferase n=1 Tax=Pirellula sp. SH-Sr6A TaxID=1632865 RepID=UPI00078E5B89|nr:methyltransferase [Pirellula sp. SH-Sr6A]AMV34462.1 Ribosomal RNA small subunit methyltransferase C [Pirellula sp. SH-Sr6A]